MSFRHRIRRLERAAGHAPGICRTCGHGAPGATRIVVRPPTLIGAPPPPEVPLARRCAACGRPETVRLVVRPPRELARAAG